VHLWLKGGTVFSTKTLEGQTPLFGSQIQVAMGEETATARVHRVATNQLHGNQSIDIVSAIEERA
jgi:hypothetical protein